jgi:hypothetical protein
MSSIIRKLGFDEESNELEFKHKLKCLEVLINEIQNRTDNFSFKRFRKYIDRNYQICGRLFGNDSKYDIFFANTIKQDFQIFDIEPSIVIMCWHLTYFECVESGAIVCNTQKEYDNILKTNMLICKKIIK